MFEYEFLEATLSKLRLIKLNKSRLKIYLNKACTKILLKKLCIGFC